MNGFLKHAMFLFLALRLGDFVSAATAGKRKGFIIISYKVVGVGVCTGEFNLHFDFGIMPMYFII